MSIDAAMADWFYETEKVMTLKLKKHSAIMASKPIGKRLYISVAGENKDKAGIKKIIRECVTDMFLSVVKLKYLKDKLKLPAMNRDLHKLLLHTLTVFDRETESEIIGRNLIINKDLALDGLFNFKLKELAKRWDEIALLAANNASYLNNEESFNELLKFLMSAVSPKIMKLDIIITENRYKVKGRYKDGNFEYCELGAEQLMIYLINIAPLELTLYGRFDDEKLYNRLISIFDAKQQNIH